jgi:hypothetical protein
MIKDFIANSQRLENINPAVIKNALEQSVIKRREQIAAYKTQQILLKKSGIQEKN